MVNLKFEKPDIKTIIMIISILLVFTGFRFSDLVSFFYQTFFPEPIDTIYSVENPEIYDWARIEGVSGLYYIEQKISLPTTDIVFGKDLKFKIKIINHGKKEIEEPRLVIYVMDSFLRSWGIWEANLTREQIENTVVLKYKFPSLDRKEIGTWRIESRLYDDSNLALTSYARYSFLVEETSSEYLYLPIIVGVVLTIILSEIRDRLKKRVKKLELEIKKDINEIK